VITRGIAWLLAIRSYLATMQWYAVARI
jgi:hypothetical protein